MKQEASPRRECVNLIFDQEAPSGRSSSRSSSSSSDSSYSSSRGSRSSRRSPSSSSDSDASSRSRSRSRSHPRCSGRSRCRHRQYSPPRRYRARSRSYSPTPEGSSHRRRYHRRSPSPSPYSYSRRSRRSPSRSRSRSRSRGRSPVYWRGSRFVGRYRCRFSRSPQNFRAYRSRSRSHERSAIRLSHEEKKYLLDVAKANAARILGVQNLELPASLKELEEKEKRRSSSDKEERVRADLAPQKTLAQVNSVATDDGEAETSQMSPKRKPITFSLTNAVAKPSNSPTLHDSKVTSRADSVADRKPYGQWVPISKSSSKYNKR